METINTDFENWGSYLMKQFHTMYEKGERCDLEINCNKQIFLVHRLIMSACSDYVRELDDKQHIILPEEVSCKTLKTVIDFVYSGKIIFHKEDKEDLLIAARLLNMRLLIELIKREDPSSYTISMDDDDDRESELINSSLMENCRNDLADGLERRSSSNFGKTATKRKSDAKSCRNKSPKKNCVVLPQLHQFPYLQQKFSATRTYGLITNLTKPIPSRFAISDAELETSSYRSTFHDVTYDTKSLYPDPDTLRLLEPPHIEFVKKLKDTSGHRRNHVNALYSPFDKYTPPCGLKVSDSISFRRSESVVSYPSKADAAANVRKYQVNSAVTAKETISQPTTPVTISSPAPSSSSALKEYKRADTTKSALSNSTNNVAPTTEKRVRFSDNVDVHEIDVPFPDSFVNDLEKLPEPIMPSAIVQDASPLSEADGYSVELIKLSNVVVPSEPQNSNSSNFHALEESPNLSISVVQNGGCETNDIMTNASSILTSTETVEVEENRSSCQIPIVIQPEAVKGPPSINEADVTQVPSNSYFADTIDSTPAEQSTENISSTDDPPSNSNEEVISAVEKAPSLTASLKPPSSNINKIATDASLFTPLVANINNAQTSTELNSQIFALKVKGTESPAQLDKLVDLCKNNPLFKNKNIRFKIVPVKGAIKEKLQETTLMNSGISKAIIVKRTESSTPVNTATSLNTSPNAKATSSKSVENPKQTSATDDVMNNSKSNPTLMENVSGPWNCKNCGTEPLTFDSYYEYRTHLHNIHKEPNNPIYCIHCGYKSVKRNMQLYHSFVKHNMPPPSYVKFPKCDKCEFHALNEHYLQKHLICHPSEGMEYVCSCKVAFKSSDLLQKHMVSGDCKNPKSFTCGYCRCVFDRFVNLKAHMRVCMKERSKPMLENSNSNSEARVVKTISDGGKDYLAL